MSYINTLLNIRKNNKIKIIKSNRNVNIDYLSKNKLISIKETTDDTSKNEFEFINDDKNDENRNDD